jgi:hypothetical protein
MLATKNVALYAKKGFRRMTLPDEVINAIKAFAEQSSNQKRLLAITLVESGFVDEIPHGRHEQVYEMIADEWNRNTGEWVTGRTIRYWIQSAKTYTRHELQRFQELTSAQLMEAVKLAIDCQNETTPQEICEWCIKERVDTVSAMRAHWMQQTGTPEQTDPPALSGIIRLFGRLFSSDHPERKRIDEIINELRNIYERNRK